MEREINLIDPKIVIGETGQLYINEKVPDEVLGVTDRIVPPESNEPTTQAFVEGD